MRIKTDKPQHGFSLVEILLTMVLILCLAAASVFTFTALYRSANLDEGNDRFQSLIRFAQAEAATTGRKVRLQFVPARSISAASAEVDESSSELRNIEVTWEADALNSPGVFQTYTNKAWSEEVVNELVGIEKVQPIQSPNSTSVMSPMSAPSPSAELEMPADYPGITFYPDGSCDPAQIVLASRNPEDVRRIEVRLSGMLGSVSTRTVSADQVATADAAEAEELQDYDALFQSSEPVSAAETETQSELSF